MADLALRAIAGTQPRGEMAISRRAPNRVSYMAAELRKLRLNLSAPGRSRTDNKTLLGGPPLPLGYGGPTLPPGGVGVAVIAPISYDNFSSRYIRQ